VGWNNRRNRQKIRGRGTKKEGAGEKGHEKRRKREGSAPSLRDRKGRYHTSRRKNHRKLLGRVTEKGKGGTVGGILKPSKEHRMSITGKSKESKAMRKRCCNLGKQLEVP